MKRRLLVTCLIAGLVAGGCRGTPVADHQPNAGPTAVRASTNTTYYLMAWKSARLPGTNPATAPVYPHVPRELDYQRAVIAVRKGQWIGFHRQAEHLVAFAGPVRWTLEEGHYRWTTLERENRIRNVGDAAGRALGFVLTAAAVTALVVLVVWFAAQNPPDRCRTRNLSP